MRPWSRRRARPLAAIAALALAAGGHARESFTIAVIPDTQNYVDETHTQPASLEPFKAEMQWLAHHKAELNLAFVTHVGDMVQHGDGTNGEPGDRSYGAGSEWRRATEAMDILAASGVPFGVSIGNHDYDNHDHATGNRPLRSAAAWRRSFGSASRYFAGKPWYGGASDGLAHNPGLSSYQTFSAAGRSFLHISLELEASDAALTWAQSVIDRHRGYPTIVTTHAFIEPPVEGDDSPPLEVSARRIEASYLEGSPGGWNGAQKVWEKLVAKNDQIFMIVCGHSWRRAVEGVSRSQNVRVGLNESGHAVYQVVSDYQGNTRTSAGGDGWLRLIEFDLQRNTIHFTAYSPTLGKKAGQNGERTFDQASTFSDFALPMPVQVTSAAASRPAVAR